MGSDIGIGESHGNDGSGGTFLDMITRSHDLIQRPCILSTCISGGH